MDWLNYNQYRYINIKVEKQGRVAVVTLNRPDNRNALHMEAHAGRAGPRIRRKAQAELQGVLS